MSCPCAPQPMLSGSMTTRCVVIVRACREIQRPRGRCPPLAYVVRLSCFSAAARRMPCFRMTDRRAAGVSCDEGQKTLSQWLQYSRGK